MIGLVLVTHGRLAAELLAALEHVVGPQNAVRTVCVGADDDLASRRVEISDCIDDVDQGGGVILLTDMFGGTPSNLCVAQMTRANIEVLGGVNLPMLVKLAKTRDGCTLVEAVERAQAAGRKYIAVASAAMPNCRARAGQTLASAGIIV